MSTSHLARLLSAWGQGRSPKVLRVLREGRGSWQGLMLRECRYSANGWAHARVELGGGEGSFTQRYEV